MGKETWKGRSVKTQELRCRQLNRGSRNCMCKQSKIRNSYTASHGRHEFSHLQESRAPSLVMVPWEEKHHHPKCPPSFFFFSSSSNCWVWRHMVWYIPLASWGQLPWLCPLPASHASPARLLAGQGEAQNRPWRCASPAQHSWNIPVLPTLLSSQIQNISPYKLLWRKLNLSQPKPVQYSNLKRELLISL